MTSTKTIAWRKHGLRARDAQTVCANLIELAMNFSVTYDAGYDHYAVEVHFDIPDEEEKEDSAGWLFKRREDGYIETPYKLYGGDYDYFVELNGAIVEYGHTFESAMAAKGRHIGDVKILAKKRSTK